MLIDCDTCTVRGDGCADCVVTVLLGAPPGRWGDDPGVVQLHARPRLAVETAGRDSPSSTADSRDTSIPNSDLRHVDTAAPDAWSLVELDEVERRAVGALADCGLVPPLRHQDAQHPEVALRPLRRRHVS